MFDFKILNKIDWNLLFATFLIPVLGLIILYSAGFNHDIDFSNATFFQKAFASKVCFKQLVFMLAGLVVLTIVASISPNFFANFSFLFYSVGVTLLLAVSLFGVVSKGSRRWLDFGPLHLQPSEMMKIGVILALARYLSKNPPPKGGYTLIQLILPFAIFLVPMAFIIKQPDLGTGLAVGGIGFMMVLFMGINWKALLFMFLTACAIIPIGWSKLHDYQKNRIINLFDPDFDPKGSGYHVAQSKIAVGSGQIFGKGFLKGTQTQLEFLPEHTTDFIFSVVGEEWGLVGCIVVILSYLYLLSRILSIAGKSRDLFQSLVVVGVGALIFFHAFINLGMVVGILPVVGIPLPLFSYGGSSIITMLLGIGLVMGVSVRRGYY